MISYDHKLKLTPDVNNFKAVFKTDRLKRGLPLEFMRINLTFNRKRSVSMSANYSNVECFPREVKTNHRPSQSQIETDVRSPGKGRSS